MARTLCGEDRYPTVLLAVAGRGAPDAQRRFPQALESRLTAVVDRLAKAGVDSRFSKAVR